MRLLYVAAGIELPGSHGGSTHALEVAEGLTKLGYDVHVVAHSPRGRPRGSGFDRSAGFDLRYLNLPKSLSLFGYPLIARMVQTVSPDLIMERYYNLAGAGILAASRYGLPSLLEVNALIVDPPAVLKRRLDDRLGGPLRRWATWQCSTATRIVTPLATTVPAAIPRDKIVELAWGANVDRFRPLGDPTEVAALRDKLGIPPGRPVVVFAGSFRAWHGVHDFVSAAVHLLDQGAQYTFLLIGDGPERTPAERLISAYSSSFCFTGSLPHDVMPDYLRLAQVGVAPFNTEKHPALRAAGFFWSPLKIYEYMAAGLPVVTPTIPPLDKTIREGVEGALYREGDVVGLASAIRRVVESPNRAEMGRCARQRVVQHFSWQRHCRELDRVLQAIGS